MKEQAIDREVLHQPVEHRFVHAALGGLHRHEHGRGAAGAAAQRAQRIHRVVGAYRQVDQQQRAAVARVVHRLARAEGGLHGNARQALGQPAREVARKPGDDD